MRKCSRPWGSRCLRKMWVGRRAGASCTSSSAPLCHLTSPTICCICLQELHHRGVSAELAAAALRSVFGEDGLDLAQHLEQLDDEQGERLPLAHAGEAHCSCLG